MRKLNECTGNQIEVTEIDTIFRASDNVAYSVYKDNIGKYYIDAYDGAYSIAEFSGAYANDADAISAAQKYLDEE